MCVGGGTIGLLTELDYIESTLVLCQILGKVNIYNAYTYTKVG